MPDATPRLDDYVLLGRSGLRVSRLCLGTMTFGTEWGWGSAESAAREMFDRYLDAGGNFIDTADGYTGGTSETLLGKFIRDRGNRDRVVLATKFTFGAEPGNPNAGGNGRKNIQRALEGSLRRLQTDCIDLYWMHAWDGLTPVEEVLSTLDALVRAGKVRAIGFSDVPAWYLARAQTLAEFRGWEPLARSSSSTRWWSGTSSASTSPPRWPSAWVSARGARWRAACSPASTAATARSRDRDGWEPSSSPAIPAS